METKWQKIETAPRDGTTIALLIPYKPRPEVDAGYWEPLEDSDDPWIPHWHRTLAACRADERAHHMPPGSCLLTRGKLPGPVVSLDSDGDVR